MLIFLNLFSFAEADFETKKLLQSLKETNAHRTMRVGQGIPNISQEAYKKAANGDIVTGIQAVAGYKEKIAWGVAVLKAPMKDFWASINDGEQHAGKTPVSFAKVIVGEPCHDKRQMLMILPVPVMMDRWWIIQTSINTKIKNASQGRVREMSWINVPNADKISLTESLQAKVKDKKLVEFTRGAWFVLQLDDEHVLGEYHTWASGGDHVPASITESLVLASIVKTMRVMEDYASSTTKLRCLNKMP